MVNPADENEVYFAANSQSITYDGGYTTETVPWSGDCHDMWADPKNPNRLMISDDGGAIISLNRGKTWTNVTRNIPGLPAWGTVSNIEPSRYDAGTAYITVDFHQMNNRDPFVYKTTDYGKTWTSLSAGIPKSVLSYCHCVH